jgi:transposase InsO family protein
VTDERLKFAIRADSGREPMRALCEEFSISRPTGYLWLKRYRDCERLGDLGEASRRPLHSPYRTPANIEQRVVALRNERPDWGAQKLEALLHREGIALPRITIHRILLRHGLIEERDRRRAAVKRFAREAPNQMWQMDFKGMPLADKGCLPLVVLDDHSRYSVGLFATPGTEAAAVQRHLTTVFLEHGMPDAMLMDHGTPWWNMKSESGWTWLTVWVMRRGIRLYLSGYRHPQTQGKVERFNGSLERAMRKRPRRDGQSWQEWLDEYRQEYNHLRPHAALNMQVPAQHWVPSSRLFEPSLKEWDYADPRNVHKVGPSGVIRIAGRRCFVSRALAGQQVQIEPAGHRVLIWFCRTLVREFDLVSGVSHHVDYGQFDRARTGGL